MNEEEMLSIEYHCRKTKKERTKPETKKEKEDMYNDTRIRKTHIWVFIFFVVYHTTNK